MSDHALLASQAEYMVDLRHRLHQIPEVAFKEFKTAELVRAELSKLGIDFVAGVEGAPTATIAWVGDTKKECIALRADIDALPITEQTGLPYASTHPGRMHACGHDGHTTTLLGAAGVINQIKDKLNCCVKFIWQPAEESIGGANVLVKAGVLDGRVGPKVTAIFGLHGWPSLEVGVVSTKPGILKANTDRFAATFLGSGGHAARPQEARDPIIAVAQAVLNLQQVVSREVDPMDPVVVTIGKIEGGTTSNVIPDSAGIRATVRTVNDTTRAKVQAAIARRLKGIALANNCELEYTWIDGYPAVINDVKMTDYFREVAKKVVGVERYIEEPTGSMGGEDFAFYLKKVPGCFFLVGVRPASQQTYPGLHNSRYDFTDEAMQTGARLFIALVEGWGR